MNFTIEQMSNDDWEQVRLIYLEGIATGNATFEQSAPTWEKWDAGHLRNCRLVARSGDDLGGIDDGGSNRDVAGWAALSPVSSRCVYQGVAEVSIYVGEKRRGIGIGRALLFALTKLSEADGIWTLQAGILAENEASINLHLGCGFRIVGRRERLGKLKGEWRDVILLERRSRIAGVD